MSHVNLRQRLNAGSTRHSITKLHRFMKRVNMKRTHRMSIKATRIVRAKDARVPATVGTHRSFESSNLGHYRMDESNHRPKSAKHRHVISNATITSGVPLQRAIGEGRQSSRSKK